MADTSYIFKKILAELTTIGNLKQGDHIKINPITGHLCVEQTTLLTPVWRTRYADGRDRSVAYVNEVIENAIHNYHLLAESRYFASDENPAMTKCRLISISQLYLGLKRAAEGLILFRETYISDNKVHFDISNIISKITTMLPTLESFISEKTKQSL